MKLAVAVPMYNEAKQVLQTLEALRHQTRPADLVVLCDNGSTDNTSEVVQGYIDQHNLNWYVVPEPQKGTGAASDTAIRKAIDLGATHVARTDADCLPRQDWLQRIQDAFVSDGLDFVAGLTWPRRDDFKISNLRMLQLILVNEFAILFVALRPSNYGRNYRGVHRMAAGNNLAITSDLYLRVGGFKRTRIEELHEDHALMLAVRSVTTNYALKRRVRVYASARRLAAWGLLNSLRWYRNHDYRPPQVDIR